MTLNTQDTHATRVDMHCHSTASQISKLGVQRAVGLPECATPPEEVYTLAKRRGMDFVTITDHDTIDGVLQIADRPDVFVSEELTAHFRGEPQAVHVLCYGLSLEDHEWLQAHSGDVELCAAYLYEREIACALAHPYYNVGAPLTARHRRRLAELFSVWEVRNGARARELNRPAAIYVATREGIGIGGSDDHAGVDIGRTWSETPPARTPREFLAHLRAGHVAARGDQGSAAKWAHAAIALAARALGRGTSDEHSLDPRMVMTLAQRLLREGDVRHGATGEDLTPEDARRLLRAWLGAVELDHLDERGLIAHMQEAGFRHGDLYRRACRAHERKLRAAIDAVVSTLTVGRPHAADRPDTTGHPGTTGRPEATDLGSATVGATASAGAIDHAGTAPQRDATDLAGAATGIFQGCIAAIPYAPAAAFLGAEKAKLDSREGDPPRVAILADGIGSTHGVTRTIEELRRRGVPGFEVEVIGTDPEVDRRLSAVAEVEVPFYPGLRIGVPSLTVAVETLAEGRFDAIHVCSPGPVGIAGALLARGLRLPLVGSYHTELTAYAALRSQDAGVAQAMDLAVRSFYGACDLVLSPSPASDEALRQIGVSGERTARWDRGVDTARFDPSLREAQRTPGASSSEPYGAPSEAHSRADEPHGDPPELPGDGTVNVLYSGRITREKGSELLADAFLAAHRQDPRLHLVLAGGGPEQERLRERLGPHATFLGWLEGQELARAYARADIFLFASATDTFGQVILEAQASGLPVVALARGGPLSLVRHGVSGLLCEPDAHELAARVVELAGSPLLRQRLAAAGLAAVRERTWESALERLAAGYRRALATGEHEGERRAA
jgi:glycosyltransferase involved in cell wall biosynthesis/predicted metal-dependent phosphoesterase TrpH